LTPGTNNVMLLLEAVKDLACKVIWVLEQHGYAAFSSASSFSATS
jgi:hypothetical protein